MPTLGEACAALKVNRVTLRKWCERLKIEPHRHELDWRFWMLSDDEVEQIRQQRALMPEIISSPQRLDAPVRRYGGQEGRLTAQADRSPIHTPPKQPRQPQRQASDDALPPIPDGHIGRQELANEHGIPPATLVYWCNKGLVETLPGRYQPRSGTSGGFKTLDPVTPKGLAQLYELASHRSDWRSCPDCPHRAED